MTARTKSWWRAAASMRSCSACKLPATADQLGFGARLLGEIPQSHLHAHLLEEFARRRAAGEDPDVIVGDLADFAIHVEPDGALPNFYGLRVEDHLHLTALRGVRDALRVALLDAAESLLPVRQRHLVAALVRQAQSRFHGAVAAADDQDVRIGVRFGFDQSVHHLAQLFSRNTELARRTPPAEGEDHRPGAIARLVGLDRERAVRFSLNLVDFLPETQDLFL